MWSIGKSPSSGACPDRTPPRAAGLGRHASARGAAGPAAGDAGVGAAGGVKSALNFLLCCRCCQALVSIFSPYHSLGAVAYRPDRSGGFLWRWDPSSPTTFYPCGPKHPSPDSLCVLRREPEVRSKATPSIRRLLCKARKFHGSPSPAPRLRRDSVPQHRCGQSGAGAGQGHTRVCSCAGSC